MDKLQDALNQEI